MSLDEITALSAVASRHPGIDLYVFGSIIHGHGQPHDLDLLAVYGTLEEFDLFRADLDSQTFSPIVDLVAMTPDELRGSGFLERSGAVPFTEVGRTQR